MNNKSDFSLDIFFPRFYSLEFRIHIVRAIRITSHDLNVLLRITPRTNWKVANVPVHIWSNRT